MLKEKFFFRDSIKPNSTLDNEVSKDEFALDIKQKIKKKIKDYQSHANGDYSLLDRYHNYILKCEWLQGVQNDQTDDKDRLVVFINDIVKDLEKMPLVVEVEEDEEMPDREEEMPYQTKKEEEPKQEETVLEKEEITEKVEIPEKIEVANEEIEHEDRDVKEQIVNDIVNKEEESAVPAED